MNEKKKHKFIKKAVSGGKGKLHEHLNVPQGEKIPAEKLEAATNSKDSTIKKEAVLAKTMRGFNHKKAYRS